MKLCKDCRFYESFNRLCLHPKSHYDTNPVDGLTYYKMALGFRRNVCGVEEARFFEPKKPFWLAFLNKG